MSSISKQVMLSRSQALVIALVGKQNACLWWTSSNLAFDNITPELMFKEDPDRIYNYLMQHAIGDYQ
jgi:hypothetical protein